MTFFYSRGAASETLWDVQNILETFDDAIALAKESTGFAEEQLDKQRKKKHLSKGGCTGSNNPLEDLSTGKKKSRRKRVS